DSLRRVITYHGDAPHPWISWFWLAYNEVQHRVAVCGHRAILMPRAFRLGVTKDKELLAGCSHLPNPRIVERINGLGIGILKKALAALPKPPTCAKNHVNDGFTSWSSQNKIVTP